MAVLELVTSELRAGRWEGVLRGSPDAPEVEALFDGRSLDGLTVIQADEGWAMSVPVPPDVLNDGTQVIVLRDRRTQDTLGRLTLAAGPSAEDDLVAEVELLRTELDLLKAAFRRHVRETGG
jgi:hypothetical protein